MFNYDEDKKTIIVERNDYHCVSVVKKDVWGEIMPQAHVELVGSRKLELDLSPEGNKAVLRTALGEKEIRIEPSVDEYDRILVGYTKGKIVIGELKRGFKDGKEGLIEYLGQAYPEETDLNKDICMSRLESILLKVAEKSKLLLAEPDIVEEMNNLMKRDDFEFEKDYKYLYENNLLIGCIYGENHFEAFGKLSENDSVFEATDIVVFCNGHEVKDFGETWSGIGRDADDYYHSMLCGYLNNDEAFKEFAVSNEIKDLKKNEQDIALTYEDREIPKFCFNTHGEKLELQMVLKQEKEENFSCYYALDDYNVILTDKSGGIMTDFPEFYENGLYEDVGKNAKPLFLSEAGKEAYDAIRKEILKDEIINNEQPVKNEELHKLSWGR